MIDRDKYTSHIHDNDALIKMRQLIDKIEIVLKNHTIESTDFLDPYERRLAYSILNRFMEIDYIEQGGYEEAERQAIIIFPEYYYLGDIPDHISLLRIDGSLENVSHPDYLGALLNLGIDREKIGDILVYNDYGIVVAKNEITNFIHYSLKKIGRYNVKITPIDVEEVEVPEIKYKEIKEFLSSLRLDALISASYNLSRKDSNNLINSNKVKVNWEPIDRTFYEVEEGDMISTRGYGRMLLYEIEGRSRKGKYISKIRLLE